MTAVDTPALDLAQLVADRSIDTVIAAFADPYGRLMGKRIPAGYFAEHVAQGEVHACDYLLTADVELQPLPGFAFSSWEAGYGDMVLKPVLSTLRLTPWFEKSALVLCDLQRHGGRPIEESPRRILQQQIASCRSYGFDPLMASELEFFAFKGTCLELQASGFRPLVTTTPYIIDYDILGTSHDEALLRDIRNLMPLARIDIEGSKGEWGCGQHEVNLAYCGALEMADRHVVFKQGVKQLALKHGVAATFMAKVARDMAGSSCHIHVSLLDAQGNNAFWDGTTQKPAALFEHFLAGCMEHARQQALLFAPLVNSYKRYQSTSFAPISVAWDVDNRTCGFRVVGHGPSLRIENRMPGADVNPYLAFAATLAAGLDGIERKLPLPAPTCGNAYQTPGVARLPTTLADAVQLFASSEFARRALGPAVADHYLRLAQLEQANYDSQVTDWEIKRYFERV